MSYICFGVIYSLSLFIYFFVETQIILYKINFKCVLSSLTFTANDSSEPRNETISSFFNTA